jgi:DNA polymerase (family 10)
MDKRDVSRAHSEVAVLLELRGENTFRVRAYENAARAIDALAEDLGARVDAGTLTELKGIGDAIAGHIAELWRTGRLKFLDELVDATPPVYLEMIRIPGLGAKKVRALGEALGVTSIAMLRQAAERGAIRDLKGFGAQSEKKVLEGIALLESGTGRSLAGDIRPIAERLLAALRARADVEAAEIGGSLRRWAEGADRRPAGADEAGARGRGQGRRQGCNLVFLRRGHDQPV